MLLSNWLTVAAATTLSALTLTALIITLSVFDGQPTLCWNAKVNLSAIVSMLTQSSGCFAGFANGATIFQHTVLKLKKHPMLLSDVDLSYRAAHGSSAGLQLLAAHPTWIAVTIPALLICLGLAVAPFAQNAVSSQSGTVLDNSASLPVARVYNYTADNNGSSVPDPGALLKHSVENAWLGPSSGVDIHTLGLQPACPTGDCTFPPFQSLGATGKCIDLSPNITTTCTTTTTTHNEPCQYSISGSDLSLSLPGPGFNMTNDAGFGIVEDNLGCPQQLMNFAAIAQNQNGSKVTATRCVTCAAILYMSSTISGGFLHERQTKPPWINATANLGLADPGTVEFYRLAPPDVDRNEQFYFTNASVAAIELYTVATFAGTTNDSSVLLPRLINEAMKNGTHSARNDDMAAALSVQFRMFDANHSTITGKSIRSQEYFQIRWAYLTVPFLVVIGTVINVIYTITVSQMKGERRYDADLLELMNMGFSDTSRRLIGSAAGAGLSFHEAASRTYVTLSNRLEVGRLSFVGFVRAPTAWIATRLWAGKMSQETEGVLEQVAQNAQQGMSGMN